MKRLFVLLALAVGLAAPLAAGVVAGAAEPTMPACAAGDPVVWVNTKTNVYHTAGDRYYGKTKAGKYACESQAVAAGAHAASATPGKHRRKNVTASPAPSATP